MTHAQPRPLLQSSLSRSGEQIVGWIRELEECRIGGIVTDEDYGYQRAEKLASLLSPMRWLWLASLAGTVLFGAPSAALIFFLTQDPRYAAGIGLLAGAWGFMALGRALREKFIELQLCERRKILVALLENDLLTASEFADYEERLAKGHQDVLR